jgi:RimJ/RimL family protein N-acetyltransferase
MKYMKKLVGKQCYLSPISLEDAELYTKWLNDLEITQYLNLSVLSVSLQGEKEALQRIAKEHNYAVVDTKTNNLIGNCGLHNWDKINQTAEIGIFIGDRDFLGKGYGTEAMKLLIQFAFDYLNIHSILLRVFSYNERAHACYRKVGFREIGAWKESLVQKGKRHDTIFMEITPEIFTSA